MLKNVYNFSLHKNFIEFFYAIRWVEIFCTTKRGGFFHFKVTISTKLRTRIFIFEIAGVFTSEYESIPVKKNHYSLSSRRIICLF